MRKQLQIGFYSFSPAVTGYHPKYYFLGFRAGALNSHLCLGQEGARGSGAKGEGAGQRGGRAELEEARRG